MCDDLGTGFAFRHGVFDGCVSISAVQWLCHSTNPQHDPLKRVRKFFAALRAVLASGARAVLQRRRARPRVHRPRLDAAIARAAHEHTHRRVPSLCKAPPVPCPLAAAQRCAAGRIALLQEEREREKAYIR